MMHGSLTATASAFLCARNHIGRRMLYSPFAAAVQGEKVCHGSALSFPLATEYPEVAVLVLP